MGEVVKIDNEQEWEYVKNKINNPAGLVDFRYYKMTKDIGINIHNGKCGYVDHYISSGYKIISFEEFKSRYKPLKIGDTFEKDGFICEVKYKVKKWVYNTKTNAYYKTSQKKEHLKEITDQEFINQLEENAR